MDAWTTEWCSELEKTGQCKPNSKMPWLILYVLAPDFANVMRFVSTHLALLVLSKGANGQNTQSHQIELKRRAKESLEYLLGNLGHLAPYICRTVCAMISWEAVVFLRVCERAE
jgi:hypothetical protein